MTDKRFMDLAIEEAYKGIKYGSEGGPFGAVITKDGLVLAMAHNTVLKNNDPTQHAEMNAISLASAKLGTYDLSGCVIYSTTEPCPMCFSAIHWAKIDRVVYGTGIDDVKTIGFNELTISAAQMKKQGASPVIVEGGFMYEECMELLKFWETLPNKKVY
ncbi:MAG: nucleoside deaminase [Candidatus Omnitrophica bacterium]|nr:nucleoside deaminase [Candidatus Omnitrophota bacterium]